MYYSLNHNDQIISITEDTPEEEIQFSSEERNPTININDETISNEPNIETQVNDINDKEVSPDIEKIDENNDSISIRKSKRLKIPKKLYPIEEYVTVCSIPIPKVYVTNLSNIKIPKNIEEASMDERWKSAMDEEIYALEKNNTWKIVNVPINKKTVGCKWLFNIKYKPDGNIDRFKARLVAKGYTQVYGLDYMETFSPVAKMTTVRILISLAACKNWNLYQHDVKNAFLHGDLEEEIYMDLPQGYKTYLSNKVCKLQKTIYGLKQSPRAWFGKFTNVMKSFGYCQCNQDHTLFFKYNRDNEITLVLVYVDDIIVIGNDTQEIITLKEKFFKVFDMKYLGILGSFLGMEISYSEKNIFISQQRYILNILTETGFLDCKPISTPIDPNFRILLDEREEKTDQENYQRLVGKLIYLSTTRLDIAYFVNILSQFMHDPRINHLQLAHRVLRYLKGTIGYGIKFIKGEKLTLEVYTDADFANSRIDRKSIIGMCTFLGGNLVSWKSKKQKYVSLSSAESEIIAIEKGVKEALWIKNLFKELHIELILPIMLMSDNKSAISMIHDPIQHELTKHIDMDRNFIKERIEEGTLCTPYIPSECNYADMFTKGLTKPHLTSFLSKLKLENLHI